MSDPSAYKEIGDPTVAGSKWGQTSGTSTDIKATDRPIEFSSKNGYFGVRKTVVF